MMETKTYQDSSYRYAAGCSAGYFAHPAAAFGAGPSRQQLQQLTSLLDHIDSSERRIIDNNKRIASKHPATS
jgi:hypothetical protein